MTTATTTVRPAWDTVLAAGIAIFTAGCVVTMAVLAETVIPPLVILPVLFGVVLLARRRWHRGAMIAAVVLGLLSLLGNAPFLREDLTHAGQAPAQFAVSLTMLVGVLAVLVGAVGSLRSWPGRTVRPVLAGAAAIIVVGAIAAGAIANGNDSDTAESGDVTVVAEDISFTPERVTVEAGGGVFVENRDLVRHTFTVEGEAVDVSVPAGRSRRVAVDLPPGTYAIVCEVTGHEDMRGALVVG